MLERLLIFLVLGAFVFSPGISDLAAGNSVWYGIYIPWVLLILAASRAHWRRSH